MPSEPAVGLVGMGVAIVVAAVLAAVWLLARARRSFVQYRTLFDEHPEPLFVWNQETHRIIAVNAAACTAYGYTAAEFAVLPTSALRVRQNPGDDEDGALPGRVVSQVHRRRDGALRDVELRTSPMLWNGERAMLTLVTDVTERNLRERQARRISRFYAAGGKINRLIFGLPDPQSIFQAACDISVEAGEFRLAWIGLINESTGCLNVAAYAGRALTYLSNIRVSIEDVPEGRGPMGMAIRERRIVIDNEFLENPATAPWRAEAVRHGLRALICAPIFHRDTIIGALGLYGGDSGMFQEQEVRLIAELTSDISLALDNLDRQARLRLDERIARRTTEVYERIAADEPLDEVLAALCEIVREQFAQSDVSVVRASGVQREPEHGRMHREAIVGAQGQDLGAIQIERPEPFTPSDDEKTLLQSVAKLAAIAIERAMIRDRLEHQALHDALTDLPNRLLFHDRLQLGLAAARRRGSKIGVGILDLDRFKLVNDTLGHTTGDELLRRVAERFRSCLRAEETIARMGGDEFLVMFSDLKHPMEADRAARRLLATLDAPFEIAGHELYVRGSLGMVFTDAGFEADVGTLLQQADKAMYQAKRSGESYILHMGAATEPVRVSDLELESDLHRALTRNEFVLHYHPFVDQERGTIVGVESLIRWEHPVHGRIAPDVFIPIAEATGMIVQIGAWTIATACAQAAQWKRDGLDIPVAVNISARQLSQDGLHGAVVQALAQNDLRADRLWLEVTETAVMESPDMAAAILADLKRIGVRIVIDDFGTGYSSLAYLHRFPIDLLKIDRSFVSGMGDSPAPSVSGMEIARAIIALANGLSADVLAEGVESIEQRDALLDLGCRLMQGFLFAKPVPAEEIPQVVQRIVLAHSRSD